jgi:MFS family permease
VAGVTAAASVLPGALSGPVLGAWLDVATRRRVLIVLDQLLSVAALIAIVALAGHAPNWTLPVVAVAYSITRPFSSGSFFSALAEIAGAELLDSASAIEATSLNVSVILGPVLAGVLAGAVGAARTVETQAALSILAAVLIAINPAFEARSPHGAVSLRAALRDGLRVLAANPALRATGIASSFAGFGWGMMFVCFPIYAVRDLHSPGHTSGFLWAAVAGGSILGTFVLRGRPTLRRVGLSYAILGLSALLWPLADTLVLGVAVIGLTGFLEGPAYSGTIALRQRHAPPAVRAQVMTTLSGIAQVALSLGALVGGAVHDPLPLIGLFVAINALAALTAAWPGRVRSHGSALGDVQ